MNELECSRAISLRDSGDVEGALAVFRSMLENASSSQERAALLMNVALCELSRNNTGDAVQIAQSARTALASDPSPEILMWVDFCDGVIAASQRNYEAAVRIFSSVSESNAEMLEIPEHQDLRVELQERLGCASIAAREFDKGIDLLEPLAAKKIGRLQMIHLYLGIAYSFGDNQQRAQAELLQYAKLGIGLTLSTASTINSAVHKDMTGAGLGMGSYLKAPTELAATSAGWGWAKWIPFAGAAMDVASSYNDASQAYSDYSSCMAGH